MKLKINQLKKALLFILTVFHNIIDSLIEGKTQTYSD